MIGQKSAELKKKAVPISLSLYPDNRFALSLPRNLNNDGLCVLTIESSARIA